MEDHLTSQRVKEIDLAVVLAKKNKLIKPTTPISNNDSPTGVTFDSGRGVSLLNINPHDPFFEKLKKCVPDPILCWLLVIAHESGHLLLNEICLQAKENPSDPIAQLKAIGISKDQYINIPDHSKESAIEAYCDATLAKTAYELFPEQFQSIIENVASIREQSFLVSLLKLKHSDYVTGPSLRKILEMPTGEKIEPTTSAENALHHQKSKNFLRKTFLINAKQTTKTHIGDMYNNTLTGLSKIKEKLLTSRVKKQDGNTDKKPKM